MGDLPMNNKKKIALTVVAVICVALLATLYFWNYDREKRYSYSEKNTVAMGTIISQKVYGDYSAKHIEKITALINGLDNENIKYVALAVCFSLRKPGKARASVFFKRQIPRGEISVILEKVAVPC